jgi:hypothetical protein
MRGVEGHVLPFNPEDFATIRCTDAGPDSHDGILWRISVDILYVILPTGGQFDNGSDHDG